VGQCEGVVRDEEEDGTGKVRAVEDLFELDGGCYRRRQRHRI
jgi:hypothetical protein